MYKKIKAFTMIEIMIVIVIVGIIALFSIPNYVKVIAKADERNMISNLMAIRAALEIYTDSGWALGEWDELNEDDPGDGINDNLGISILDPKAKYECGTAGLTNGCKATHAGWGIYFHDDAGHSDGLLHCDVGTCPSCASNPVKSDCVEL